MSVSEPTSRSQAPAWAPAVTTGAVAAGLMQGPSLFPKDVRLQRVGTGAAALLGAGIGAGTQPVARSLDAVMPGDRLDAELTLGGAGAALAAGIQIASRGRVTGGKALVQTGGMLTSVGAGAGAASSYVASGDAPLPGSGAVAQLGTSSVIGGAALALATRDARAARGMSHLLPDLPELSSPMRNAETLAVERGPQSLGALTSGGPDSAVAWDSLPGQGKRFVTLMPTASEINTVMGTTGARDPIRVYVGLDAAGTAGDELASVQQRAALAVDDLDRLGAFGRFAQNADGSTRVLEPPRKSILVVAPTSSGFVNPVAASSNEFFELGDTATVTVQVARKKAAQEMHRISRATAQHQILLEAIGNRIASIPAGIPRPELRAYGESFGAWTSQNGMLGTGEGTLAALGKRMGKWNGPTAFTPSGGIPRMDALGVQRAMYVGTPHDAKLRERLLAGNTPGVEQVKNLVDAKQRGLDGADDLRITYLQHDADPVALFTPRLLAEKPAWLGPKGARGDNIAPQQRWYPVITGLQTALDQQMAQYFKQGVLEAKGHDYRSEVSYVLRRAFGATHVSDEQVARVREWNRQLELIHARQRELEAAAAAKK